MPNCSDDFPTTDVLYDEISDDTLNIVFLAFGCLLGLLTIIMHVEIVIYMKRVGYNAYRPHFTQRCALVGLYPVICVMSLITLLVPTSTVLIDLILSCYLSVCIFTFVQMTVDYYGGEAEMIEALSPGTIQLNTPPCCCCCCCILKPIALTKRSLTILKGLSMQVAIVRPIVLFLAAVLWTDGKYEQEMRADSSYPYIAVVSGVSTVLSMYGMIVMYRASREVLRPNFYIVKFGALQAAVVLINLQSLLFNILADNDIPGCLGSRGPRVRASALNHAILVIESFLLCLLARWGYRKEEPHLKTLLDMKNGTKLEFPIDPTSKNDNVKSGPYDNSAVITEAPKYPMITRGESNGADSQSLMQAECDGHNNDKHAI